MHKRASRTRLTNGAAALCISGSGSTLLSVVHAEEAEAFAERIKKELADSVYGWRCARTSRARGCLENEKAPRWVKNGAVHRRGNGRLNFFSWTKNEFFKGSALPPAHEA